MTGSASSCTNVDGTMYGGSLALHSRRSSSTSSDRPVGRHHVGDEPLVAGRRPRAPTTARRDVRVRGQHRLDLAELDAEAAELDLLVDPAEELERAVGAPAHEIARAVQPRTRIVGNGFGTNFSAVSSGRSR